MSAFTEAVQDFVQALLHESYQELNAAFDQLVQHFDAAEAEEAGWAVYETVSLLVQPEAPHAGFLSCLQERCMSRGADPWLAASAIVNRLPENIERAERFYTLCVDWLKKKGVYGQPKAEDFQRAVQALGKQYLVEGRAWVELDLLCGSAAPVLYHFRDGRDLFRTLGGSRSQLRPMAAIRPGVQALLQVLEDTASEEEERANPSDAVDPALAALADATATGGDDPEAALSALRGMMQAVFMVERGARLRALHELAQHVAKCDPVLVGHYALVCGSLVESGCDPSESLPSLLERLPQILAQASAFLAGCDDTARASKKEIDSDQELLTKFGQQTARKMPEEARAFGAVDPLCQSIITHLARLPEKRQELRGDPALHDQVRELAEVSGFAGFLTKILRVLDDEEIVVLSPDPLVGFRVKIHGVGDNFQLHALLAGTIIGPEEDGFYPGIVGVRGEGNDEQPGRPLPKRALGVASDLPCTRNEPGVWSRLQLWTWQALQPDGTLPADYVHADHNIIVWNEGIPDHIPAFEGTRVILLGPASVNRGWNGGRIFPAMRGGIELLEKLTPNQVKEWLKRIGERRAVAP